MGKIKDFNEVKQSYLQAHSKMERVGIAAGTIVSSLFLLVFGSVFGGFPLFFGLIPALMGTAEPEGARWVFVLVISGFVVAGFCIAGLGVRRIVKLICLIKSAPPVGSVPVKEASFGEGAFLPNVKEAFGQLISTVRDHRRGKIITSDGENHVPEQEMTWKTRLVTIIFGSIFFAVGAGVFGFGLSSYLKNQRAAETWVSVPCEILSASIEEHRSSGRRGSSTSYSPELNYRYTYGGQTFTGEKETLIGGLSMDYQDARAELKELKKYKTCWVDPENPGDSVLKKPDGEFSFDKIIPMVFALPFMGMGGLVAVCGIFRKFSSKKQEAGLGEILPEEKSIAQMVAFAVLWNLILSVFICVFLAKPQWFIGLFLLPFFIVGIVVAIVALNAVRKKFSSLLYSVTLNPPETELASGMPVRVYWKMKRGSDEKLIRLCLNFLEMERDTNTQINGKPVLRVIERTRLCESGARSDFRGGACDFVLPEDHPTRRRFFAFELELERKSSVFGKTTFRFPVKIKSGSGSPSGESEISAKD